MPSSDTQIPWEVLVVDDDEGIIDLITSYFNELRIPVTGASDGRAAITTLQRSQGQFGLVITDLSLPGADGFAVLQAARLANSDCYVVIVTGYASIDSAVQAVRVGAYDYLAKPFSMGQLDVVLRRIADRSQLTDPNRNRRADPPARPHVRPVPAQASHPTLAGVVSPEEVRMARMEASLARIESRLDQALGVTLRRR